MICSAIKHLQRKAELLLCTRHSCRATSWRLLYILNVGTICRNLNTPLSHFVGEVILFAFHLWRLSSRSGYKPSLFDDLAFPVPGTCGGGLTRTYICRLMMSLPIELGNICLRPSVCLCPSVHLFMQKTVTWYTNTPVSSCSVPIAVQLAPFPSSDRPSSLTLVPECFACDTAGLLPYFLAVRSSDDLGHAWDKTTDYQVPIDRLSVWSSCSASDKRTYCLDIHIGPLFVRLSMPWLWWYIWRKIEKSKNACYAESLLQHIFRPSKQK